MKEKHSVQCRTIVKALLLVLLGSPAMGGPVVTYTSPAANSYSAEPQDVIEVRFDQLIDPATITSDNFRLIGTKASYSNGTFTPLENGFIYHPDNPARQDGSMLTGDTVYGIVTDGIRSTTGEPAESHIWTFRVGPTGGAILDPVPDRIELPAECGTGEVVGILAVDLNGDICDEMVIILRGEGDEDRICVLLGSGTGWGSVVWSAVLPSDPTAVCTGDFDNNGLADIAVVSFQSSLVHVFWNTTPSFDRDTGRASEISFERRNIDVGERGNVRVEALDVDGDGYLDLVVGTAFHDLRVLMNNRDGGFDVTSVNEEDKGVALLTPPVDLPHFGVGNLLGPGSLQIAMGNLQHDRIDIWDAPYTADPVVVDAGQVRARFVLPGRFLGDERVDLLAVTAGGPGPATRILYENMGDGGFVNRQECDLPGRPGYVGLESILVLPSPQLILSYPDDGLVEVRDAVACTTIFSSDAVARPGPLAVSDVGVDGDLDLIVFDAARRELVIFRNPAYSPDPVNILEGCTLDFGTVERCPTGNSAITQGCSIRNIFDHAVYLNSFRIEQPDPPVFDLISPGAGESVRLEPGETYQVEVEFDLDRAGNEHCEPYKVYTANVVLGSIDCGCVVHGDFAVVGLGAASELAIKSVTVDGGQFSGVLDLGTYHRCELEYGDDSTRTVRVRNTGRSRFTVSSISEPGADSPVTVSVSETLPAELRAEASLDLEVSVSEAVAGFYQESIVIHYQGLYDCRNECRPTISDTLEVTVEIQGDSPIFIPPTSNWTIFEHQTPVFEFGVEYEGDYSLRMREPPEYLSYLHLDSAAQRVEWRQPYNCGHDPAPDPFTVMIQAWDTRCDPDRTTFIGELPIQVSIVCVDDPPQFVRMDCTPNTCDPPYQHLCDDCGCTFDPLPRSWPLLPPVHGKHVTLCTAEEEPLTLVVRAQDPEGSTELRLTGYGIGVPDPVGGSGIEDGSVVWQGYWKPSGGFTGNDACKHASLRFLVRQGDDPALADTLDITVKVSSAKPNLTCTVSCDSEGMDRRVGDVVRVEGRVLNDGHGTAPGFRVELWMISPIERRVGDRWIEGLGPGALTPSGAIVADVVLDVTGEVRFELRVDVNYDVVESNEDDNRCVTARPVHVMQGELCVCPVPITPNDDGYNDVMRFSFAQRFPRNSPQLRIFDLDRHLVFDSDVRRPLNVPIGEECQRCRSECPGGSDDCELIFDGRDSNGSDLPGGLYLYIFSLNGENIARGEVVIVR